MLRALLFLFLASLASCRRPKENPNLFQGDITGIDPNRDRNAVVALAKLWPNGIVYYRIDNSVAQIRDIILDGIKEYHTKTCLQFKPYTRGIKNYINIISDDGCYSDLGMTTGMQTLSLGSGCELVGTVIHEFGHAIGFSHEQNRSDRDDYLEINWDNIEHEQISQFEKLLPWENNFLNEEFDLDSIMLYGNTSFSKDGRSITMLSKDGQIIPDEFEKSILSPSDVRRVNRLYQCNGEVRPTPMPVPDKITCDFEKDICDWRNDDGDFDEWRRFSGNIGNREGTFIGIDARDSYYDIGNLITRGYGLGEAKPACMSINVFSNDVWDLTIYMHDKHSHVLFEDEELPKNRWKTLHFNIDPDDDTVLFVFSATKWSSQTRGQLLLDDFELNPRPCA